MFRFSLSIFFAALFFFFPTKGSLTKALTEFAEPLSLRNHSKAYLQTTAQPFVSNPFASEEMLDQLQWNLKEAQNTYAPHRHKKETSERHLLLRDFSEDAPLEAAYVSLTTLKKLFMAEGGNSKLSVPRMWLNGTCTAQEKINQKKSCSSLNDFRFTVDRNCNNYSHACYQERLTEICNPDLFSLDSSKAIFTFPSNLGKKVKQCLNGLDIEKKQQNKKLLVTYYSWSWNPFSNGYPQGSVFYETFKKLVHSVFQLDLPPDS